MKKNLFISICTALGLLAGISSCSKDSEVESMLQGGQQDATTKVIIRDSLTVEVDTVGQLKEKIGDRSESLQKLIVSGSIDATDVRTIREMPNLLALNLKNATICGGDSTYTANNSEHKLYDNVVGSYMFNSQVKLSEIILPDNITEIDDYAFYCLEGTQENPFKTIVIPEGVTRIGEHAFYGCEKLTEVTLPSSLKSLEAEAFQRCSGLQHINLEGIEEIGNRAFNGCSSLQSVELADNLQLLGYESFSGSGLTSITIPGSIARYNDGSSSQNGYNFSSCKSLRTIVFPENMTEIPDGMFWECSALASVDIPDNVTRIGGATFYRCTSLREINLGNALTRIESEAFNGCRNLKNITFPETLTYIGENSFRDCEELTSIVLPENTARIGDYCFYDCTSLSSVTLSDQMTILPRYAFSNCENLSQVTIPEKLEEISEGVFAHCVVLNDIEFPSTLKEIGGFAFRETGFTEVILPDGVETLHTQFLRDCPNLTSVTIPQSAKSVEYDMFSNCLKLTSIFWNTSATVPTLFSGTLNYQNPNCLLYLSDPNTLVEDGYIKNIIVNGVADEIVLSSVHGDFFVPQEFKTTRITYTRDFTFPTYPGEASGWRSICLPFTVENIIGPEEQALAPFGADEEDAPSIGDDDEGVPFSTRTADAKPFWLRRLTPNGFENVTRIEANVPYIIAMPNNEAYDDEYNIRGTVTFRTENAAGITIPATGEMTQDVGPAFTLNCNFSYHPASATIYVLNEQVIDDHPAGSVFVRNERDVMPFEGYVSSNALTRMFAIDAGRAATRSTKPLGPVPSIDDM